MIDKSQILNVKPEPQTVRLMKLILPTSSPTIGNTNVIGSFVVPADYDEGPECEDDGCEFCNDIHCDGSCQEEDW